MRVLVDEQRPILLAPGGTPGDPPRNLATAFNDDTPLWFYILKEAEVRCSGKKLGPVGGRIVAEVLVGLLAGDRSSFLSAEPTWQPKQGQFGAPQDGKFFMSDLLRFAGVKIPKNAKAGK